MASDDVPIINKNKNNAKTLFKSNLRQKYQQLPKTLVEVQAKPDESAESLVRRFNREVMRAGIMRRLKELEFYEKPSRKRKREEALKKYKAGLEELPYEEES